LKKEFLNKGYAPGFVKKFIAVCRSLPHENARMRVKAILLVKFFIVKRHNIYRELISIGVTNKV
jgi:hypothetical protein